MAYVEFLRARRVLLWYFGILLGIYALGLIVGFLVPGHSHVGIVIDTDPTASAPAHTPAPHHALLPGPLPVSVLVYAATYGALLVAAILGSSLNRQREHLPLAWTRPLGRERFVLSFLAVDAVAIVLTLAGTLLYIALSMATSKGNHTLWYLDSLAFPMAAFGLGAAFMTYALAQAVTSWYTASGGLVKGLVCAACGVLVGLGFARLPSPYDLFVAALNYLNPLAYFAPIFVDSRQSPAVLEFVRLLPLDFGVKLACVWLLAAVYMAIATYGWKRLEI
jgi:hypothetical protein